MLRQSCFNQNRVKSKPASGVGKYPIWLLCWQMTLACLSFCIWLMYLLWETHCAATLLTKTSAVRWGTGLAQMTMVYLNDS